MKQGITLSELAAELERQERAKVDYIADTRRMHFNTDAAALENGREGESELDLIGEGATESTSGLVVLDHCHRQIATRLGIPWRFYQRLRGELPVLLDENVNRLFHHKPEKRMIRTLDGRARAFLSDSYRRLDNGELARTLLPILGEIPELRVESCAITDERMYIKAVTPRVTGEVKVGEAVCAGVLIANSEVGMGRLRIEPFVYTLICRNGMVIPRTLGAAAINRVHVGRRVENEDDTYRVFRDETLMADDRAFFMACADVVRAAVDEVRFHELVEAMRAAAADETVQSVVGAVQRLAKVENLSDGEQESVLTHLARGGDLSRWGVLSAVTRTAEDQESYDRATELEELGGKLLAYSPGDWRSIARAQATAA
jgi:hypothetical protein